MVNGSYKRMNTGKNAVSSSTPDFYSLKDACAVASKERKDVASVDLPGLFLQTKADEEDDLIIIKMT